AAGSVLEGEVRRRGGALREAERDVVDREARDRRVAHRGLLEGEVPRELLAEDVERHALTRDAEIRAGGNVRDRPDRERSGRPVRVVQREGSERLGVRRVDEDVEGAAERDAAETELD